MLAAEVGHRLLGLADLVAQAAEPGLEEGRRQLHGLGVHVDLVLDVGLRQRVGQPGGLGRLARGDRQRQHEALRDPDDIDPVEQVQDHRRQLRVDSVERGLFRPPRFGRPDQGHEASEHAGLGGGGELGVGGEVLLGDDLGEQSRRQDDGDLAVDDRGVEAGVGRGAVRAEDMLPARVEQDLRGRGEHGGEGQAHDRRQHGAAHRDTDDQPPAPRQETPDLVQIEPVQIKPVQIEPVQIEPVRGPPVGLETFTIA